MVKIQRFFIKYKRQILITITILLILAEIFQWVFKLTLLYQILMAVAGVIGVIPIILAAISSLKVKLISIDVLVSLAVIGAFTIGEFNEAAIVTWLFMLGEVLEDFTLKKTRSAVSDLVSMAPQTALVVQEDGSTEEEDVDFIDCFVVSNADSPAGLFFNYFFCCDPFFFRKFFRIVQDFYGKVFRQNYTACNHRARKRSAPCFIKSTD